jgi:hypothetical protein
MDIIGSFNNYGEIPIRMAFDGEKWYADVNVQPGENYYRFLVNDEFELNDPAANMYIPHGDGDELWSYLPIDKYGRRLYNNQDYTINIESYNITDLESNSDLPLKRSFNPATSGEVVLKFGFNQIKGMHSVTIVWYDSLGRFFASSNNYVYEDATEDIVYLWFNLDLHSSDSEYPNGNWSFKMFIDGEFILEDEFSLRASATYSFMNA